MSVAPALPPTLRSGPPTSGAPPGAPPDDPLFQGVLAEHWARTATAEGQDHNHTSPARGGGGPDSHAGRSGKGTADSPGQPGPCAIETPVEGLLPAISVGSAASLSSTAGSSTASTPTAAGLILGTGLTTGSSESHTGAGSVSGALPLATLAGDGGSTGLTATSSSLSPAAPGAIGDGPGTGMPDSSDQSVASSSEQVPLVLGGQTDTPAVLDRTALAPTPPAGGPLSSTARTVASSTTPPTLLAAGDRLLPPADTDESTLTSRVLAASPSGDRVGGSLTQAGGTATALQPALAGQGVGTGWTRLAEDTHPAGPTGPRVEVLAGHAGVSSQIPAGSIAQFDGGSPSVTPTNVSVGSLPSTSAGVDMQQMIDSVRATVELAIRQGGSQARIALQPADLGGIRVHLSQTAEGLLARLVPETQAAAQALADGHRELHRSLSSLGLPLLRMDIGSFGQSDARPREDRFAGSADGSGPGSSSSTDEKGEKSDDDVGLDRTQRVHEPADGGLVNVLA